VRSIIRKWIKKRALEVGKVKHAGIDFVGYAFALEEYIRSLKKLSLKELKRIIELNVALDFLVNKGYISEGQALERSWLREGCR